MSSLPPLTAEEREKALAKAREARSERAAALASLENGTLTLGEFLYSDDEVLKRTHVRQALLRCPGVGPATADKAMAWAKIASPQTVRVRGLGRNQRDMLLGFFTQAA